MFNVEWKGGAHLKRLQKIATRVDSEPFMLMDRIGRILVEGNLYDREGGVNAQGLPMAPLRSPRIGPYAGLTGPPMAPSPRGGVKSRSITLFAVDLFRRGRDAWLLVAGFEDKPHPRDRPGSRYKGLDILRLHRDGRAGAGKPIKRDGTIVGWRGVKGRTSGIHRDVFGVSPRTGQLMVAAFKLWTKGLLN